MKLLLMRHGEAEPETSDCPGRFCRLTQKGREETAQMAEALGRLFPGTPLRILTSPFRRTRETAAIVSSVCGSAAEPAEELMQTEWTAVAARCVRDGGPLLLVSHDSCIRHYLMSVCGAVFPAAYSSAAVIEYDCRWRQGILAGYLSPGLLTFSGGQGFMEHREKGELS